MDSIRHQISELLSGTSLESFAEADAALAMVLVGLVYLLLGVGAHRILMTLAAGIYGGILGLLAGAWLGFPQTLAILLGGGSAVLTWVYIRIATGIQTGLVLAGVAVGLALLRDIRHPMVLSLLGLLALLVGGFLGYRLYRPMIIGLTALAGGLSVWAGLLLLAGQTTTLGPAAGSMIHQPLWLVVPLAIAAVGAWLQSRWFRRPDDEADTPEPSGRSRRRT